MKYILRNIFIIPIKIYQLIISPFITSINGHVCRFSPTCSDYTIQAIQKHGVIKGIILGFKRIMRCNPLSKGGYDPVE